MVNRFDRHDKNAQERLRLQDDHIKNMGTEHETYHKTVLGRLDEFGRAQEALRTQLAEQRRQHQPEKQNNDMKIAELERGLKEAREAAEARAQAQTGQQAPGELTLRVAGFERDTPAEEIEKVARRYLSLSKTPEARMKAAAEAQVGDFRVFSPFLLSSFALVNTNAEMVRRIIAEARQHQGRPFTMGGKPYKLRVTLQKTKEERDKNRRLVKLEEVVYMCLREEDSERSNQPWQMVCWRTATVIAHGKRTMSLNRDHETLTMSADGWWRQDWYRYAKAEIHMKTKKALEHDLNR